MTNVTRWRGETARPPAPAAQWDARFRDPEPSNLFNALLSNFQLIAAVTLLGAVISYGVLKSIPPQFTSSALIMLDSSSTLLDDTQGMFAGLPIADTYIESEIELIRSDTIVHKVIREGDLLRDPEFSGSSVPDGIERMIAKRASGDASAQAEAQQLRESVSLLQVAKEVRERLDVSRRGLSQGIVVSFRSRSQVKSRDLANAFAESYVADQLDNKLAAGRRATDWLRTELTQLAADTQKAESAVEAYREQNKLVGEGEQGVSTQRLRLLNESLAAAQAEESAAQVKVDQLRRLRAAGQSPLALPEIGEKATVLEMRKALAEAEREEAAFANRFVSEMRDRIPHYQEAHARVETLQADLAEEVARAGQEIEARLSSAQAVTRSLEQEVLRLRGEHADVNAASIGLKELEREATAKRQRYEALLDEYNKADSVAAAQTPHARIVSPAELPLSPSAPQKAPAFAAAVVFSFAFGVLLALLREYMRKTLRTSEELQAATGLRPIGVIPRVRARNNQIFAAMKGVAKGRASLFAESVRSLRTELALHGGREASHLVCVTSADTAAGKATVASSLARSLALAGSKTLLVDADIREPRVLSQLFKTYEGPDFAAVLRGEVGWRDAELTAQKGRLSVLGARPGGWDEIVSHAFPGAFKKLIEEWRKEFAAIIVNAPVTLACPEARIIASCADDVIMCVQWNATDRRRVLEAIDLLRHADIEPNLVLTHVARRNMRRIPRAVAPPPRERGELRVLKA